MFLIGVAVCHLFSKIKYKHGVTHVPSYDLKFYKIKYRHGIHSVICTSFLFKTFKETKKFNSPTRVSNQPPFHAAWITSEDWETYE